LGSDRRNPLGAAARAEDRLTTLAALLFLLSLALGVWSYLLYPPVVRRLAARVGQPPKRAHDPVSVEVLISAADEEAVIAERVHNLRDEQVATNCRVAVGCDGSADRTAQRAREAGDGRIRVVEFPHRRGKAAVLNDLIASSEAEILVFTDANTRFEAGAVSRLTAVFADPSVGAACGRLVLEGSGAETAFWDRETRTKEAEGALGVCLGANGAIYAARRAVIEPLPPDTTMDDFLIPLRVARRGKRVVFVGDAVAREGAARDALAEMGRRFRIGVGAGQVLRRERWLWNPARQWRLTLAFLSRKVARWLAPVAGLGAVAAACLSQQLRPVGFALAAGICLLALSALLRPRPAGLLGRLYYFGVINLALAVGMLLGLFGYSRPVWKPVARENPAG
jgi:cellulose synthase/poly-beta-1,6-N-acetylglucosamine synthase-like glycosyltransferase